MVDAQRHRVSIEMQPAHPSHRASPQLSLGRRSGQVLQLVVLRQRPGRGRSQSISHGDRAFVEP